MKNRFLSVFLSLCLCLILLPTAAFAEGGEEAAETPVCICDAACTADAMNTDCPVCGAEGAAETDCAKYVEPANEPGQSTDEPEQPAEEPKQTAEEPQQPVEEPEQPAEEQGEPAETPAEPTAVERVQAMLDALPTAAEVNSMDEDARDEAYMAAQEAYDALEELSADELAALTGVEALEALLAAFTEEPETYADDWGIWLGGVNVREHPTGTGYSYDEENNILTLTDYTTNKASPNVYSQLTSNSYQNQNAFLYSNRKYYGTGEKTKREVWSSF